MRAPLLRGARIVNGTSRSCTGSSRCCGRDGISRRGVSAAASSRCWPSGVRSWPDRSCSCWTNRAWDCRRNSSWRSATSSSTSTARALASCSSGTSWLRAMPRPWCGTTSSRRRTSRPSPRCLAHSGSIGSTSTHGGENMADKKRIGFIGLGIMGSRMARTLSRAGHGLTVFDVNRSRMDALKAAGASVAASAGAVAQGSEMVFSSLPVPATVKTVYLGPDGVLEGAAPGTILVDMSTVDPETTRAVSKAAAEKNLQYLDAPVSGGYREAENGTLVIIVGGDRDDLESCREVLGGLGSPVHYAGP